MEDVTLDQASCLIRWPMGTEGYQDEERSLEKLLDLCHHHGYGHILQLAEQIMHIQRCPEAVKEFKAERKQFLAEMRRTY